MSRTRRATLAMLAGSSGLLAIDTLGLSSAQAERSVSVDVVDDPDAFLGLTEDGDGVETGGRLFEDGKRREAPETFHLLNGLAEPVVVDLESDAFEFDPDATELPVGESDEVTVDLRTLPDDPAGATAAIGITAEGDATRIEADRSLTLVPEAKSFAFTVCRGQSDNCVDVHVTVSWNGTDFGVAVTVDPDERDGETQEGHLESDDQLTFDLDFEPYGSSEAGNWTVTDADPDPGNAVAESGPGESVTLDRGPLTVELDPDATGTDEQVRVTVSASS